MGITAFVVATAFVALDRQPVSGKTSFPSAREAGVAPPKTQ
jgi:hypothetical protein